MRRAVRRQVEVSPGHEEMLRREGLDGFEGVWAFSGGRPVTMHGDRSVFEVEIGSEGGPKRFYIKRLSAARPKQVVEALMALEPPVSKCRREWEYAARLEEAGVCGPPLAAMGEARLGPWPLESFLIVEGLKGAVTLDTALAQMQTATEREPLLRTLAGQVARMHDAGLWHRDLYAKHIFVRREGGKFVINIIDLQRMRRGGGISAAAKDLAALNVTLPWEAAGAIERMRFLREYLRGRRNKDGVATESDLARRVLRRSERIAGRSKFRRTEWQRVKST